MKIWYPKIFHKEQDGILGVFMDAPMVYMVELNTAAKNWEISYTGSFSLSEPVQELLDAGWVEELYSQCQREGLAEDRISLCLPVESVFSYEKVFPQLEGRELAAAIHWEMEAAVPFEEGGYLYDSLCIGVEENRWLLAATSRSEVMGCLAASRSACLQLACITGLLPGCSLPERLDKGNFHFGGESLELGERADRGEWPEGMVSALYAAAAARKGRGINFLPAAERPDGWNWLAVSLSLLLAGWLLLGGIYGYGQWQLHVLGEECRQQQQELARLSAGVQCQQRTQQLEKELQSGSSALQALSQQRFPWYALLVHFGTQTVEGVWLTDLRLEKENCICVQGQALTYEALSALVARLEEDKDFFSGGAVLKNSESRGRGIVFSMQLFF